MAYEERLETITREAGSDLSASQYRFVNLASDNQVDRAASAGVDCLGVLQNKPDAAGRAACIATGGTSKVVAGGTFDAGDKITTDNQGRAVEATTGQQILGIAMEAGVSGVVTSVNLEKSGVVPA